MGIGNCGVAGRNTLNLDVLFRKLGLKTVQTVLYDMVISSSTFMPFFHTPYFKTYPNYSFIFFIKRLTSQIIE